MTVREPIEAEMIAFLDAQPRTLTYSALAAALAERFGQGIAWNADAIRAYFLSAKRTGRARVARDGEVRAFIKDRIGRLDGGEILAELRAAFPAARVPSRTALYRFIAAARAEASQKAAGASVRAVR
jgi:hypothetical protein